MNNKKSTVPKLNNAGKQSDKKVDNSTPVEDKKKNPPTTPSTKVANNIGSKSKLITTKTDKKNSKPDSDEIHSSSSHIKSKLNEDIAKQTSKATIPTKKGDKEKKISNNNLIKIPTSTSSPKKRDERNKNTSKSLLKNKNDLTNNETTIPDKSKIEKEENDNTILLNESKHNLEIQFPQNKIVNELDGYSILNDRDKKKKELDIENEIIKQQNFEKKFSNEVLYIERVPFFNYEFLYPPLNLSKNSSLDFEYSKLLGINNSKERLNIGVYTINGKNKKEFETIINNTNEEIAIQPFRFKTINKYTLKKINEEIKVPNLALNKELFKTADSQESRTKDSRYNRNIQIIQDNLLQKASFEDDFNVECVNHHNQDNSAAIYNLKTSINLKKNNLSVSPFTKINDSSHLIYLQNLKKNQIKKSEGLFINLVNHPNRIKKEINSNFDASYKEILEKQRIGLSTESPCNIKINSKLKSKEIPVKVEPTISKPKQSFQQRALHTGQKIVLNNGNNNTLNFSHTAFMNMKLDDFKINPIAELNRKRQFFIEKNKFKESLLSENNSSNNFNEQKAGISTKGATLIRKLNEKLKIAL